MKWFKVVSFLIVLPALLAACAGRGSQADSQSEPVSFTIEMTEFTFNPAAIEVKVGQEVTLELVNKGALDHELMIGRDVKMTNSRPDGYQHDMFEQANVEPMVMGGMEGGEGMGHGHGSEHTGFMVTVPAGPEKATVTFRVTEEMVGEWEMGCFAQEGVHYDAAMKGAFIVSE